MKLSDAVKVAQAYEAEQHISTPAKACITLLWALRGMLNEELYLQVVNGEFDENDHLPPPLPPA